MQYFNFSRLLGKYKRELTIMTYSEGSYDNKGDYVKGGMTESTIEGAVINFSENKVYRSGGTITANDKRLFLQSPLGSTMIGSKAVLDGNEYSVEDGTENAAYTGVYAYTLKYVSAFEGGDS